MKPFKNYQFVFWGRRPTYKSGTYTPDHAIYKFWYFGFFEIRKFFK
jgi:hypothetical protein